MQFRHLPDEILLPAVKNHIFAYSLFSGHVPESVQRQHCQIRDEQLRGIRILIKVHIRNDRLAILHRKPSSFLLELSSGCAEAGLLVSTGRLAVISLLLRRLFLCFSLRCSFSCLACAFLSCCVSSDDFSRHFLLHAFSFSTGLWLLFCIRFCCRDLL